MLSMCCIGTQRAMLLAFYGKFHHSPMAERSEALTLPWLEAPMWWVRILQWGVSCLRSVLFLRPAYHFESMLTLQQCWLQKLFSAAYVLSFFTYIQTNRKLFLGHLVQLEVRPNSISKNSPLQKMKRPIDRSIQILNPILL